MFFDLVLVAAVAGLADQLHKDHSLQALAVFAGLFVPVWWAWWGFTWYSTAFNDDDAVNRIGLLVALAGVAALAVGAHGAGHGNADTFVVAYAALFVLLAGLYARAWVQVPSARQLTRRYVSGDLAGASLWLVSLAFDASARPVVWAAAMLVLMATPVLAAASHDTLSYDARHIGERYGLFTLIVLGESVTATVAGLDVGVSADALAVAVLGLVVAAGVWWLYFDRWRGMPAGGLLAGWVWAQGHLLVFAGIASAAVGVEFLIAAAAKRHALELADRLPLCAGIGAYLLAMALIRGATRGVDWVVALRLGAAAFVVALAATTWSPALLMAAVAAIVVAEAAIDLIGAPPPEPRPPTRLPHEIALRRFR